MKEKGKYNPDKPLKKKVKELEINYATKGRIRFSTLETQGDIQLEYSLSLSPEERIRLMYKLNAMVFEVPEAPRSLKGTRIIFSRYEHSGK
jgi:hypothetical protein